MWEQNKGSQKQFEEQMARCNKNYYNSLKHIWASSFWSLQSQWMISRQKKSSEKLYQ